MTQSCCASGYMTLYISLFILHLFSLLYNFYRFLFLVWSISNKYWKTISKCLYFPNTTIFQSTSLFFIAQSCFGSIFFNSSRPSTHISCTSDMDNGYFTYSSLFPSISWILASPCSICFFGPSGISSSTLAL